MNYKLNKRRVRKSIPVKLINEKYIVFVDTVPESPTVINYCTRYESRL